MSDEKQEEVYAAQLGRALESVKTFSGKDYIEILSEKDVIPGKVKCDCGKEIRIPGMQQVKLRLRVYDMDAWTHQFLPIIYREQGRAAERVEPKEQWFIHTSKELTFVEESNKFKFFWNFIVFSPDISPVVRDLCRLIDMFVLQVEGMDIPAQSLEAPSRPPAIRRQNKKGASSGERNFFKDKIAEGIVVQDGQVQSIPLLGGANRNAPEGSLFEKGKSPKGAHLIGG